jgi:hypothetical protein
VSQVLIRMEGMKEMPRITVYASCINCSVE